MCGEGIVSMFSDATVHLQGSWSSGGDQGCRQSGEMFARLVGCVHRQGRYLGLPRFLILFVPVI